MRHRCGGTLRPRDVQVQDETDGLLVAYVVPGLVCDTCREELIEPATMTAFERAQTPTMVWRGVATSRLNEPVFLVNSSVATAA